MFKDILFLILRFIIKIILSILLLGIILFIISIIDNIFLNGIIGIEKRIFLWTLGTFSGIALIYFWIFISEIIEEMRWLND